MRGKGQDGQVGLGAEGASKFFGLLRLNQHSERDLLD